jgi:hypothetical protein
MLIEIIPLIILSLAAFRLTRFFVIDTLSEGVRLKVHNFFINRSQKNGKLSWLWEKLYELTSCTWCAGFWVTLGLFTAYVWNEPWDFSRYDWISVFAIAGIQGFIHAIEPE